MILFACYANDNDALIPELWANESVAILEENMVLGQLVHRDFEPVVANFGDIVHTRKPADQTVSRKTDSDTITYNDAVLNNITVPLNQHFVAPFIIKDGERSKSLQDLIAIHLVPAMKAIGNGVDRAIAGRMAHAFLNTPTNRVGRLLNLSKTTSQDYILEAGEVLNTNLAPMDGRRLVVGPRGKTAIMGTDLFVSAERRGDGGSALENAVMGQILGFDTFMDQNVNSVRDNASRDTVASVTGGAISAGETGSLTEIDVTGHVVSAGEFVILAGNDQPTWATAATSSMGDTTAATLNEEVKYAVASGAAITVYKKAAADGVYAAGYTKPIVIDGHGSGKNLVKGQLVAFGNTTGTRHTYTVIEVNASTATSTTVLLDRPLDSAVADNAEVYPGPAGDFNLAFHRNSLALVSRPLAMPVGGNAMSFVAQHNNVATRVTMQYDIDVQGTKVVVDLLAGIGVLDAALATILLG